MPRLTQEAGEVSLACHHQEVFLIPPSGSLREAVRAVPTRGEPDDRLTLPASSTLVTVTVTLLVFDGCPPLEAVTFTVTL